MASLKLASAVALKRVSTLDQGSTDLGQYMKCFSAEHCETNDGQRINFSFLFFLQLTCTTDVSPELSTAGWKHFVIQMLPVQRILVTKIILLVCAKKDLLATELFAKVRSHEKIC